MSGGAGLLLALAGVRLFRLKVASAAGASVLRAFGLLCVLAGSVLMLGYSEEAPAGPGRAGRGRARAGRLHGP